MRVLLSAFACDPVFGSDEEVGWQWAKELSGRGWDVTVITRASHRSAIERHIETTGECSHVVFEYIDISALHTLLKWVNRRNHVYYYFWQWCAYAHARKLHASRPFDVVHHVTWVSFRQPSFMGGLGIPMIFGPVAGGDAVPAGYEKNFSFTQRMIEYARTLANRLVWFDPLMRYTYKTASRVIFTSVAHLSLVPEFVRRKSQVELAIGVGREGIPERQSVVAHHGPATRLLFAGRCIGWKGMDIGLQVFARVLQFRPDVLLTIIGDGADKTRWMQMASQLGIEHAVEWKGWLAKADVLQLYQEYDLLFYPSLRDSGGFVVLEALQRGLPVVSFKLGGPGVVVNNACGDAVEASLSMDETIERYADAVLKVLSRIEQGEALNQACSDRVANFTWDALIDRVYGPLLQNSKGSA